VNERTWKLPREGTIALALVVLTLTLFAPCLKHEFLAYDDQQYITENRHVQTGLSWQGLVWAFRTFYASNWHPLTWLSHMLDCQLYGLQAAGHHLTNVMLHTASAVLLFLVLNRLTRAPWRSGMVAALFAWHPLHVESVAWVAERKDVLSGLFWMLTLWAYVRYAEASVESPKAPSGKITRDYGSILFYLLSLVFFALGLMSKPMVVTLPFVLLLLDFWPLQRIGEPGVNERNPGHEPHREGGETASSAEEPPPGEERGSPSAIGLRNTAPEFKALPGSSASAFLRLVAEKLPFLTLSAACCELTILAQRRAYTVVSTAALPLWRRGLHALLAYAHYVRAMLVPRHLAVACPYSTTMSWVEVAGAAGLLAAISFAALSCARRRPYLLVGWLWYLGTLVPVIGLVQVGDQAWADRYTYLPLIGLFILVVWGAADLADWLKVFGVAATHARPQGQAKLMILPIVPVVVGLGLMAATSLQLRYWKNTRTLFEHAAQVNPRNSRALAVLGSLWAAEGDLPRAMELYSQALSIRADDPETHYLLGNAFEQQGRLEEAVSHYTQALWFKPLQEKTHLALGVVLAKQKKYDEAAAHDRAALALDAESALAHNNLARVLQTQGRLEEAIEHYSAALRSDPTLAPAHNNLGVILLQKGRLAEGTAQLKEAVRLQPGDYESRYNLATALNQEHKWTESADILAPLAATHGDDPNLDCQLALALAHSQKTREAMSYYAHALLRQPEFPEALSGLSWILATDMHPEIRNAEEAVRMAEGACALTNRKQAPMLMTLAAAYAEAGRFPEAISVASEALDLATKSSQREIQANCRDLLETFNSGQPWRERTQ